MSKQLERIHIMKKLLDSVEREIKQEMLKEVSGDEYEEDFFRTTKELDDAIFKSIIAAELLANTIARA